MVFLHRRGGENGKRWMNSERKICVKFGDILGLLFEGNTDSIIPPGVGMWQLTDILAPQINFFTISSKVFLLYPDFSYRLTQILSTYLSRNILEEYFRFKKEHTPNTFIFKINTIISKLLSFVSLSFDRKNIRSESSRTVHTRNIYISVTCKNWSIVIGRITRIFRGAMLVNKRPGYLNRDGRITGSAGP